MAAVILERIGAASDLLAMLSAQHEEAAAIGAQMTVVSQEVLAHNADADLAAKYEALSSQMVAKIAQMNETRQQLRDVALEGVAPEALLRLARWRDSEGHRVSPAFRVVERTAEQWRSVELALRAEKRATATGQPLSDSQAALLNEVRSEPAVSEAQGQLNLYLEEVAETFSDIAGS